MSCTNVKNCACPKKRVRTTEIVVLALSNIGKRIVYPIVYSQITMEIKVTEITMKC